MVHIIEKLFEEANRAHSFPW